MLPHRVVPLCLTFLLTATVLAGCLSGDDGVTAPGPSEPAPVLSYVPIHEDRLTKAEFSRLPAFALKVPASIDGVPLHVEVHLPDAEGPFPTVLHSSPYNGGRAAETYAALGYPNAALINDYTSYGYAVVVADVRGFGESGGCVEVWGPNEQQDQYDLVEWVAAQEWSDGKVGMFGASYPGTTPIEAAVMAPPHLTTVVAVAGLTDPYFDWHFGGVPNGESLLSPAAYHQTGAEPARSATHGTDWLSVMTDTGCNAPQFVQSAYEMDGLYDAFYEDRNFSAMVDNIQVPFLYTQGFVDGNVKPSQALQFFNEIPTPKKGYFGQWAHAYPDRDDWNDILHAWFDEHLMGIDTGIMDGSVVEVRTNLDTWRADTHWPPLGAHEMVFHVDAARPDASPGGLGNATATDGASTTISRDPSLALGLAAAYGAPVRTQAVFATEALPTPMHLAGPAFLDASVSVSGDDNAHLSARLYDVDASGVRTQITYGMRNLALSDGFRTYAALPEGDVVPTQLRFQPREYVVEKGHHLELVIEHANGIQALTPSEKEPAELTLHTGPDTPTALRLPTVPAGADVELPWPDTD